MTRYAAFPHVDCDGRGDGEVIFQDAAPNAAFCMAKCEATAGCCGFNHIFYSDSPSCVPGGVAECVPARVRVCANAYACLPDVVRNNLRALCARLCRLPAAQTKQG